VTTLLNGPSIAPRSGKAAKQLVVFLHGLGADGDDLIGLAPYFAEALPDAEFISPHAPYACDMAPYGRQWFSLQDRSPEAMLRGLSAVRPILDAALDSWLAARSLDDGDLALVGFSQGTMLSLYAALRRKRPAAAVVGYSGLLARPDLLPAELTVKPPVLLLHGDQDQVVPSACLGQATAALQALQVPVTSLMRPGLGHSIDDQGLSSGINFLVETLTKKKA
jgi:phospholipase/carboxylesterase